MSLSSILMGITVNWRRNTQESQKLPSKKKLIAAEVCFAGIATMALIESIAYAILLTFSGIVSIIDIRPHAWLKLFFNSSCLALKLSIINLGLNFFEPNLRYQPFILSYV